MFHVLYTRTKDSDKLLLLSLMAELEEKDV